MLPSPLDKEELKCKAQWSVSFALMNGESQRDSVGKPRVLEPWVFHGKKNLNPERVPEFGGRSPFRNPFRVVSKLNQNPGVREPQAAMHNAFGVGEIFLCICAMKKLVLPFHRLETDTFLRPWSASQFSALRTCRGTPGFSGDRVVRPRKTLLAPKPELSH
jgi:hypothetical protein